MPHTCEYEHGYRDYDGRWSLAECNEPAVSRVHWTDTYSRGYCALAGEIYLDESAEVCMEHRIRLVAELRADPARFAITGVYRTGVYPVGHDPRRHTQGS